jgi:uncharacterized protein YyaL (SSP411 family)
MTHGSSPNERETGPRNRLAAEKSPYLLQHATNPVDWYPWGDEAFERARNEDKPIFLSIGYATCHWCHVMERESFEDPTVAALMNEAFINIKVDREERPDIDQVYMTVCQLLTGSGGWPLTILMTPDKEPFFAATYLPRESVYGRMGMLGLVPRVQQLWQTERDAVDQSVQKILGRLQSLSSPPSADAIEPSIVETAYRQLRNRYDGTHGGFGERPKFPSPHNLIFLLQHWAYTGEGMALKMVEHTLATMRLGGIYDHVGFGFHRYSTDAEWLVPHFEKMLYDQAMMVLAYCEVFQVTGDKDYRRTAREVLEYVLRDMTSPDGGFYSAEDADSEGEEGRFYLWTVAELRELLKGSDVRLVVDLFNLTDEGNFLDEATRRKTGSNILHLTESLEEAAPRLGLEASELDRRWDLIRTALFDAREKRIHPLKDDKILTDWNGLMVAAFARAGRILSDPRYIEAARRAVDFTDAAIRSEDGALLHRYRDGSAAVSGFLDDYVFQTWACLELYDATLETTFLERAIELQDATVSRFWDDANGGFFFTADGTESILVRQKEVYDGAVPSGNSVAMANLVRLARLTGRTDYADHAAAVARAFARDVVRMPSAHSHLVSAVEMAAEPGIEVVIAGDLSDENTRRLVDLVRARAAPRTELLVVPDDDSGDRIRELAPFTRSYRSIDGRPAAYVCRNHTCQLPTTDPERLAELLAGV